MQTITPVATSGVSSADTAGWRDIQAALRSVQKNRGLTPAAGSETVTARPVTAATGAERGVILAARTPAHAENPLAPTGPRPTFQTTPLERLRIDVMERRTPPAQDGPAPTSGNAAGIERAEGDTTTTVHAIYRDTQNFDPAARPKHQLDMIS